MNVPNKIVAINAITPITPSLFEMFNRTMRNEWNSNINRNKVKFQLQEYKQLNVQCETFNMSIVINQMEKKCALCSIPFEITDEDERFYRRIGVHLPELCPTHRCVHRMYFRNFRRLYHAKSALSNKPVISMYPPDTNLRVYTIDEWWGDDWDGTHFGKPYNPDRPFFDQFHELFTTAPKLPLKQIQCDECSYCNFAFKSKNCYLIFGCVENEDCMYGHIVWRSKNCFDGLYLYECELCYDCTDCVGCYATYYSTECVNCTEVWFSHDCLNCSQCFGCTGLRNKEWYWENEQIGKDEYLKRLAAIKPLSWQYVQKEKEKLEEKKKHGVVFPAMFGNSNENVKGNHIYFSKNTRYAFDAKRCEDCSYLFTVQTFTDAYDCNFCPGGCELAYNCLAVGESQHLQNCREVSGSSDLYYCFECVGCHNCFGCDGLRYKRYCILNKQYSKEEYEKISAQIMETMCASGEWGMFFPFKLSPFGYNETVAHEYFPLTKEQAIGKGFTWCDKEPPAPEVANEVVAQEIPEFITEVDDRITKQAIACEVTGRPFKVTEQELMFYRDYALPLPRRHPDQRHADRMGLRPMRKLWQQQCAKCGKQIESAILPESTETVFCEECYMGENYS